MTTTQDVIETIKDMLDDPTLQKNIRQKLEKVAHELAKAEKKNVRLVVDKCIHELDEVSNDANIQSFVRTQMWGVVSMLESLE